MNPSTALRVNGLVVLVLFACGEPPISASADRARETPKGIIRGNVVVQGATRGNVTVLLFDASRPPSPRGTGRPVSFSIVPAEALFGAALPGETGPFSAPYVFTQLPVGNYLVTALLDHDACTDESTTCRQSDWVPWFSVTNEANAGDVAGGHVDLATRELLPVALAAELGKPDATPLEGISVVLDDAPLPAGGGYPFDRPAFTVKGYDGFSDTGASLQAPSPLVLQLDAASLQAGIVDQRSSAFVLRWIDADGDGQADDTNGDGKPDMWPKIFVRKLADDPALLWLRDENDVDRNGILDAVGPTYTHVDRALDTGKPTAVILAAQPYITDPALLAELSTAGEPDPAKFVVVKSMPVIVLPIGVDVADPARPARLEAPPRGRYAVIVQQFTGQTWRVPNETQPGISAALGLPSFPGQGFFVEVE